jgi:hypothetical protein
MKLTREQEEWLETIKAAGSGGIIEDKGVVALRSLVRKGFVVGEDVEVVPATKLYSGRAMTHTIHGRLRFVTLVRYTLA